MKNHNCSYDCTDLVKTCLKLIYLFDYTCTSIKKHYSRIKCVVHTNKENIKCFLALIIVSAHN